MVTDAAQYSPGALSPFTQIFFDLGECTPLKIPQIVREDDICVLFFHNVLSTVGREERVVHVERIYCDD